MPRLEKALLMSLGIAILAALGGIVCFVVTPQQNEKFSEFYILGPQGKAGNYPQQVILGASVDVIIGVVNHEYQPASYRVEITINAIRNKEVDIGTLAHQQKWEQEVSFTPHSAGEKQKVKLWLYKDSATEPYLKDPLQLCINVRQPD